MGMLFNVLCMVESALSPCASPRFPLGFHLSFPRQHVNARSAGKTSPTLALPVFSFLFSPLYSTLLSAFHTLVFSRIRTIAYLPISRRSQRRDARPGCPLGLSPRVPSACRCLSLSPFPLVVFRGPLSSASRKSLKSWLWSWPVFYPYLRSTCRGFLLFVFCIFFYNERGILYPRHYSTSASYSDVFFSCP